jgi:hypothetical protein
MRRFWNVVRSRAGLILGGAVLTMLLLPVTAFAVAFSGAGGARHSAATGGGGSEDLAIFLGIVAAAVLSVLILSRVGAEREPERSAAKSTRRKPARAAS